MATVIDALLVTLGLDASNFSRGAKQAEDAQKKISDTSKKAEKERADIDRKTKAARDQQAKEVEAGVKRTVQGFEKMRSEALGFFATLMGASGFTGFLSSIVGAAAGLDRVSANLDMSAKDLSMWQLANERAGGSVEGMTAQLKESASEIAKYKAGMGPSEGMQWFLRLGGDPAAFKDGNTYLLARSAILEKLFKANPANAVLMAANMGVSEDTFNLLKKGPSAVEGLRQAQSRLADEMAKNAPAAEELRKKINDLKNEFTALGVKVLPVVMPLLERLAAWLIEAGPSIESFAKKVDRIVEAMGGWGVVLATIGGLKLVAMASGLSAIGLALSGIAATFAVIGGVVGATAIATLAGLGLATASTGLNSGEDEELARRRKMAPTIDGPGGGKAGAGSASATPGNNKSLPRGMRNNNPGNIEYGAFAKKHGATGSDGRFAIFPTMQAGQEAMQALLGGYLDKGHNTVGKAINRWAPGFENNTAAYIAAVSKQIGVGPDQKLDKSHLPALANAISRHENGPAWDRKAANAADFARMPVGAATAQRGNASTSTSTTDVKVGQITINTKATDAAGIAASIGPAVTNYAFVAQANGGM